MRTERRLNELHATLQIMLQRPDFAPDRRAYITAGVICEVVAWVLERPEGGNFALLVAALEDVVALAHARSEVGPS